MFRQHIPRKSVSIYVDRGREKKPPLEAASPRGWDPADENAAAAVNAPMPASGRGPYANGVGSDGSGGVCSSGCGGSDAALVDAAARKKSPLDRGDIDLEDAVT